MAAYVLKVDASRVYIKLKLFSTPEGLEDVSKYPQLIAELLMRGWSKEEVQKVSGRNIKRVMRRNEEV